MPQKEYIRYTGLHIGELEKDLIGGHYINYNLFEKFKDPNYNSNVIKK